tara:strand:- start:2230 stop:3123 length:894 start_codon:yes stop_codon:yes gene_type:complete
MPYVGRQNVTGEFIKLDAITTSATNTFNLLRNGAAFSPATAEQCIVSVNGVTQAPQDAFNISGSQIVFTSTLSANDVIDYILVMGNALSAGVPSDGSVSTAKLANQSVTTAKIDDGAITTAKLNASVTLIPTGMIAPFPTSGVPTGWLECNGAAVSRTTYADLFALISDDYGNGDGSSTFNLPDLRGQFIRGFANGQATDPDRASRTDRGDGTTGDAVGTKQDHAVEQHSHRTPATSGYNGNTSNTTYYSKGGSGYSSTLAHGGPIWQNSNSSNPNIKVSSNETRPKNVSMLYCIKT